MTEEPSNISFDAVFDADAGVWVATSAVGRITTEAPSREALIERLKRIVPDVLESRLGHAPSGVSVVINWQELRTVGQTELMVA
jgi:cytochrome b